MVSALNVPDSELLLARVDVNWNVQQRFGGWLCGRCHIGARLSRRNTG